MKPKIPLQEGKNRARELTDADINDVRTYFSFFERFDHSSAVNDVELPLIWKRRNLFGTEAPG